MTRQRLVSEEKVPASGPVERPLAPKPGNYYRNFRREILPMLENGIESVLDVGCGEGATSGYLRENGYCRWAAGIELSPEAAAQARERLDLVITGHIEELELPFDDESLDLILCLDVLEHLVDPWTVIDRLAKLLRPGGTILASIPNVRHWSVLLPLIFRGRWEYRSEGILDATHLRFFTRQSAVALLRRPELQVDRVDPLISTKFQARLARWGLGGFTAVQYLIRARKAVVPESGPE